MMELEVSNAKIHFDVPVIWVNVMYSFQEGELTSCISIEVPITDLNLRVSELQQVAKEKALEMIKQIT